MIYLITGGTGSLGQELVKHLLKFINKYDFFGFGGYPSAIRIYSRDEYKQSVMQAEFNNERLRFFIGDVRDKERLSRAMNGVDYVIHAAAMKRVESCSYNPFEAVKTNVIGAYNVAEAAIDNKVKKVLAISSDKAVLPVNLYGSTKLVAEHLFLNTNSYSKTKFSIFRSGNFIESRGNVFEIWEKQSKSGTCKLTDENMSRYFIHTSDAARLCVDCLNVMQGNEIFVPKMRESIMLDELKKAYPSVKVEVTGQHPNERIRELLFSEHEKSMMQEREDYYVIKND